jgi:hypothetical protein
MLSGSNKIINRDGRDNQFISLVFLISDVFINKNTSAFSSTSVQAFKIYYLLDPI